jgi:hypothetical protein
MAVACSRIYPVICTYEVVHSPKTNEVENLMSAIVLMMRDSDEAEDNCQ